MSKILALEDAEDNFILIKHALEPAHQVVWARSLGQAKELFDDSFDSLLVDVSLPDGDGYEFCDWIRNKRGDTNISIIFVSGRVEVESRIAGYMVGGDDYICKPFNMMELKVRVDAKLRRARMANSLIIEVGDLCIDQKTQKVTVQEDGRKKEINLTPIEYKILKLLASDVEKVFSRDEILNNVWGDGVFVYHRSVDTHVSKLRRKLGAHGHLIESIHAMGYKVNSTGSSQAEESKSKAQ